MTKRFTLRYINEEHFSANLFDNGTFIGSVSIGEELIIELLNDLSDENEWLKSQLQTYRKIASCSNCNYHDYDEFDNGDGSYDEFEVCRKGNDVTERICADWREL